jgi:hypothetical protein
LALTALHLIWFYGVRAFILFMRLIDLPCDRYLAGDNRLATEVVPLDAVFTLFLGLLGVIIFSLSPPLVISLAMWKAAAG